MLLLVQSIVPQGLFWTLYMNLISLWIWNTFISPLVFSCCSWCDHSTALASCTNFSPDGSAFGPPVFHARNGADTAGTAAPARAPGTEAETADPETDPHRWVPAAAWAALPAARGPTARAHQSKQWAALCWVMCESILSPLPGPCTGSSISWVGILCWLSNPCLENYVL